MESGPAVEVALPFVIAALMTAVGMGLRIADFAGLRRAPLAFAVGLLGMFAIFPLIAFSLAAGFELEPALAVGLVLLAASPSGSTSTLFTHLAHGDTALSLALTAISKAVPVLTIPLYVGLAQHAFAAGDAELVLSFAETSERIVLTVLVPVLVGMSLRARLPALTARLQRGWMRIAVALLVLLIGVLAYGERHALPGMLASAGLPAVGLCALGMASAFGISSLARLTRGQRIAITLEVTVKSGGTAIAIAAGLLGSPAMAVPAAIYSLAMYVFAGGCVAVARAFAGQPATADQAAASASAPAPR